MVDEVGDWLEDFRERNKRYPTVEEVERLLSLVKKIESLSDEERQELKKMVFVQFQNKVKLIRQ